MEAESLPEISLADSSLSFNIDCKFNTNSLSLILSFFNASILLSKVVFIEVWNSFHVVRKQLLPCFEKEFLQIHAIVVF